MGSTDDDFTKAKAFLQQADNEGYSVYDHVFNMVTSALERNPNNILKNVKRLPEFSRDVKGQRFDPCKDAGAVADERAEPDPRDVIRAKEEKLLFEKVPEVVTTEILRPTPFTTVTTTTVKPATVPPWRPVSEDVKYHRLCGVGIPRSEYFILEQAITKLTMQRDLKDVEFFGKIFGTRQDYIVVVSRRWFEDKDEKVWKEQYAMPKPPRKGVDVPMQAEPPGTGLNRVTFWVCEYAGAEWTPLPDVQPQHITAARQIKKYFTGDLKAAINSYPPFPGLEENYLRAQLARIWAATSICPEGEVEVFEEEDAEEEEADDDAPPQPKPEKFRPLFTDPKPLAPEEGIDAFAQRDKWLHSGQYIYKTGRGTMLPPKPEVDEEEDAPPGDEDEEEKEPEEEKKEMLQPISGDSKFAVIKVPQEPKEDEEGNEEEEKEEEEKEEEEDDGGDEEANPRRFIMHSWTATTVNNFYKKHGVVVVKSQRWPGAVAWAAAGKPSGRVYFGQGLKETDQAYAPTLPPPVQTEADDLVEMPDPTSMLEKLILRGEEPKEHDSEDEKDEEEDAAE